MKHDFGKPDRHNLSFTRREFAGSARLAPSFRPASRNSWPPGATWRRRALKQRSG